MRMGEVSFIVDYFWTGVKLRVNTYSDSHCCVVRRALEIQCLEVETKLTDD
jgi:hypothetical protein